MRDRPLLYLCLVIAAAVMLSVLFGGERFIRELRPSALEKIFLRESRLSSEDRYTV